MKGESWLKRAYGKFQFLRRRQMCVPRYQSMQASKKKSKKKSNVKTNRATYRQCWRPCLKKNFRLLQLTWKYISSFRTVTCVVLFGITFCNSKCFCSKFINFLACYLHSQKCQYWVLDSNQLILSTIVELKRMSDCPCYWSHMPKNLLSVG